jgi:hypothetical protein
LKQWTTKVVPLFNSSFYWPFAPFKSAFIVSKQETRDSKIPTRFLFWKFKLREGLKGETALKNNCSKNNCSKKLTTQKTIAPNYF